MNIKLPLSIFTVLMLSATATADCACVCVDGEIQPVCESARDVPPVCHPAACRIAPPSVAPIVAPRAPPPGTAKCRQAQVCDRFGHCRWQRVCRNLHHDDIVDGD